MLKETCQEKDLGVLIESSMKPTFHCQNATRRGMSALKLLKLTFRTITKRNFEPLLNVYVRPHIEYCSQVVGPYMKENFTALDRESGMANKCH